MNYRYDFASDTTAGICPEALTVLIAANEGFASAYGADEVTRKAANAVRQFLDADAEVRFVASGTAANAISCAALSRSFEAVLAHGHAHICTHEAGAPGFFGSGLGLVELTGPAGRIEPQSLTDALQISDSPHRQYPTALSLTNATECGTLYKNTELTLLCGLAKEAGLGLHLDGARLANAVAAGFDAKSLRHLGFDILVLGGTKAGAPLSEAVVLYNKSLARRFDARLKQAGQLIAKGRMLSAPWIGLLDAPPGVPRPWIAHAAHANAMARKLASLMPFPVRHPVESNGVFVEMDDGALERLNARGWSVGRFSDGSARFMCSWAVTEEAVEELAHSLSEIQ
jgi:threonine aldolase